jgi:hypothetical protein
LRQIQKLYADLPLALSNQEFDSLNVIPWQEKTVEVPVPVEVYELFSLR